MSSTLEPCDDARSGEVPLFLQVRHSDPFWRRQAEQLADTWNADPVRTPVGIIWDRGAVTGDPTWKDILPDFDRPIGCDPEHPDHQLLGELGDGLVKLRHICGHLRLSCFTTSRIIHGFLTSVLCECELHT